MDRNLKQIILYTTLIVAGTFLLFLGLYKAKSFLVPVVLAIILAMMMLPVAKKMEKWGISRGWAVLFSDLLILVFLMGIAAVVVFQVKSIATDWPEYEKKLMPKVSQFMNYVEAETGYSIEKQFEQATQTKGGQEGSKIPQTLGYVLSGMFGFAGNFLLVFVYIFFFMNYREKFYKSILMFFKQEDQKNVSHALDEFANVSQGYMFGRFTLVIILTVIYSSGLLIIGIKHAILISLLAAFLSLLPYIGNIVGYLLASLMAVLVQGSTGALIGVAIVFGVTQFLETYFLEPFVIGKKVNLNPVLVIVGVVAGGAVWGLVGMLIAIPILGIFKAVFDRVPSLTPLGYMLGEEDIDSEPGFFEKMKDKLMQRFKKSK